MSKISPLIKCNTEFLIFYNPLRETLKLISNAHEVYIIKTGEIKLYKPLAGNNIIEFPLLGTGDVFGEMGGLALEGQRPWVVAGTRWVPVSRR